jgi:hypothetical protein
MTYSCSDFTDSILEALDIDVPDESADSPSDQADLALEEIDRLHRVQAALKQLVADVHEIEGYWTEGLANSMQAAEAVLEPVPTAANLLARARELLAKLGLPASLWTGQDEAAREKLVNAIDAFTAAALLEGS